MIQAVIFELNGVLVDMDLCKRRAWKRMAKEQGLPFDDQINAQLMKMSARDGLEFLLRKAKRVYSPGEKLALATRHSDLYAEQIEALTREQMLPGAMETISALKEKGVKVAVDGTGDGSVRGILRQLRLQNMLDAVVDEEGAFRKSANPDHLLLAAKKMDVSPEACMAVEDSRIGMEAAQRSGMKVLAVGRAFHFENAPLRAETLEDIDLAGMIAQGAL